MAFLFLSEGAVPADGGGNHGQERAEVGAFVWCPKIFFLSWGAACVGGCGTGDKEEAGVDERLRMGEYSGRHCPISNDPPAPTHPS